MTGSMLTATLAAHIPPIYLLFVSAALIELSVLAVRRLSTPHGRLREVRVVVTERAGDRRQRRGGHSQRRQARRTVWASVRTCCCSRFSPRVLYFQQAEHRRSDVLSDRGAATRLLRAGRSADQRARLRAAAVSRFGNLVKFIGVTLTLAVVPAVSAAGFAPARRLSHRRRGRRVPGGPARRQPSRWRGRRARCSSPCCRARIATRPRPSSTPSSTGSAIRLEPGGRRRSALPAWA